MGISNREWLFSLPLEEQYAWMNAEHQEPNPDCSAMLYRMYTENMKYEPCSDYEPKDDAVAILIDAARNLSGYHDAGEALRRLTDTTNVYHALETLADMIERDYVRRESVEEVMDNDRALVEENSMLAREVLKLKVELEKATNNLNSANEDFENARAELTAERDKLQEQLRIGWECECRLQAERDKFKEANDYHAAQYELASEDCDRLQAEVDKLTAERDELKGQVFTLKCECDDLESTCDDLENELYNVKAERERYRSKFGKCLDYADAIHALMDDEGMA